MLSHFTNLTVVLPNAVRPHDILVDQGGQILALLPPHSPMLEGVREIDGQGSLAWPGFIDVLTHGFGDHLYADLDERAVRNNAKRLPQHGVTGFCPSVVSQSPAEHLETIARLAQDLKVHRRAARVLGIHSEGPFIASPGAHDPKALAEPDAAAAEALLEAADGHLQVVTIAPELPGAEAFCAVMRAAGVALHLGHSRLAPDRVAEAVDMGISGVTHMYDVMTPAEVIEPGLYPLSLADALLAEERLLLGLICDGVHVLPPQVKLLSLAARDRLFLETDSMKFAGSTPGRFELYPDYWVRTSEDGAMRSDDGMLAGSALTSAQALRNLIAYTGMDFPSAATATSLNPARSIGVGDQYGSLEPGKFADMVWLDPDSLEVRATFIAGKEAYRR